MEFLALLAVAAAFWGQDFLEIMLKKVEILQNTWSLITYANRIEENKQTLKRKLGELCSLEEDINRTLEHDEFHSGKKRKSEVENWLGNVQRKKNDAHGIFQQIEDKKYSLGPRWENTLEKNIKEVDELCDHGKSFESLLLDACEAGGEEFLTPELVGQNSTDGPRDRIWACLMNSEVVRIGVHGVKGVGKTAIMMHLHNRLRESTTFDHVFWVSVPDDFGIHSLQNGIAKVVGVDLLDEKDTRKRAARLFKGILRRKKCVLILDNVQKYFDQVEVGIPTRVNGCKLIITTPLLKVWQRMGCQENVEVLPLPDRESEKLFMEKLGLRHSLPSAIEEIVKLIVRECKGLPYKIVTMAERMRGVDDVNEWRDMAERMRGVDDVNEWRDMLYDYRESRECFSDY